MTTPERSVTYCTEARARAYVADVLADPLGHGPVYVIVAPAVRESAGWPELAAGLAALLPGVGLCWWGHPSLAVEPGPELGSRLARAYRGAVLVIPRVPPDMRRPVGPAAMVEAAAFRAAGRPVLAFTGRRLVAWPDVRAHWLPAHERPRGVGAWAAIPAAPSRPLPTLAASLRALGITGRVDVDRASAGLDLSHSLSHLAPANPPNVTADVTPPPAVFMAPRAAGQ
jgi:hypothetical protein